MVETFLDFLKFLFTTSEGVALLLLGGLTIAFLSFLIIEVILSKLENILRKYIKNKGDDNLMNEIQYKEIQKESERTIKRMYGGQI